MAILSNCFVLTVQHLNDFIFLIYCCRDKRKIAENSRLLSFRFIFRLYIFLYWNADSKIVWFHTHIKVGDFRCHSQKINFSLVISSPEGPYMVDG